MFYVDEKEAIQTPDRTDQRLPLSPSRVSAMGALSLYAAFNTQNGAVLGKTAASDASAELVCQLPELRPYVQLHYSHLLFLAQPSRDWASRDLVR